MLGSSLHLGYARIYTKRALCKEGPMKMKAYQTTATNLKNIAKRRIPKPKIDIYDDSMTDKLDELASKWALKVERLRAARKKTVDA